jgi:acyl-CoA thioester hydrolase
MRVAHHASYPIWMEEARTHLLRASGVTYAQLEEQGVFLVITKLELKYRRPIRYDDVIDVRVRHVPAGKIKIRHEYELVLVERLGADPDPADPATPRDGICAVATTELACVGRDGRPRQLPSWLIVEDGAG